MGGAGARSRGRERLPFFTPAFPPLIFSAFHLAGPAHDAGLDSRQSGSGRCRQRHHQDAGWRRIAVCALGAAGGPQGHRLRVHRPRRADRKIFRDGARSARPRFRGGDDRLARAGPFVAAPARSAQGLCPRFLRFRGRRRDLRAAGGAAGLPAAVFRAGAFDGRRGDAAGRACRQALVRPHGAVGADDRSSRTPHLVSGARAAAHPAARRAGRPLRSRRQRRADRRGIVRQQSPDQRSRALCPQCRDPRGRSDARHRLADGGLGRYRVSRDARLSRHQLSRWKSASRS